MIDAIFDFIADNPPSIAIAGGILLYLFGHTEFGVIAFFSGVVLQILWLILG